MGWFIENKFCRFRFLALTGNSLVKRTRWCLSLWLSLCLFDCLFCLCLCLCVSSSKLDQWLDPQCGLDSRVHPLTRSLNTVHSFISFHIPGIEAWNTNNMQICGSLALFKTRPVCGVGKRALLSQAHQLGFPTHPANSVQCLLAPSHTPFSSQPNPQEVFPPLYLLNSYSRESDKNLPTSKKSSTILVKQFFLFSFVLF